MIDNTPTCGSGNKPVENVSKECAVCSDRATGLHYGVVACEGCKGFFMRSVLNKSMYRCRNNRECTMSRRMRNRCQFCRMLKCLQVGMNIKAIREDRMPGGRARHHGPANYNDEQTNNMLKGQFSDTDDASLTDTSQPTTSSDPSSRPEAANYEMAVVSPVSQHKVNELELMLLMRTLDISRLKTVLPQKTTECHTQSDITDYICRLADELCTRHTKWIRALPFLDKTSHFESALPLLIKGCFFELMLLMSLTIHVQSFLRELQNCLVTSDLDATRIDNESVMSVLQLHTFIKQINMSHEEIVVLKTIIFLRQKSLISNDDEYLSSLNKLYYDILFDIATSQFPGQPCRIDQLLELIQPLTKVATIFSNLTLDSFGVFLKAIFIKRSEFSDPGAIATKVQ